MSTPPVNQTLPPVAETRGEDDSHRTNLNERAESRTPIESEEDSDADSCMQRSGSGNADFETSAKKRLLQRRSSRRSAMSETTEPHRELVLPGASEEFRSRRRAIVAIDSSILCRPRLGGSLTTHSFAMRQGVAVGGNITWEGAGSESSLDISKHQFLRGLPSGALAEIALHSKLVGDMAEAVPNDNMPLLTEGTAEANESVFYIILEGDVSVESCGRDFYTLGRGSMIGEMMALGLTRTQPFTSRRKQGKFVAVSIPVTVLRGALVRRPDVRRQLEERSDWQTREIFRRRIAKIRFFNLTAPNVLKRFFAKTKIKHFESGDIVCGDDKDGSLAILLRGEVTAPDGWLTRGGGRFHFGEGGPDSEVSSRTSVKAETLGATERQEEAALNPIDFLRQSSVASRASQRLSNSQVSVGPQCMPSGNLTASDGPVIIFEGSYLAKGEAAPRCAAVTECSCLFVSSFDFQAAVEACPQDEANVAAFRGRSSLREHVPLALATSGIPTEDGYPSESGCEEKWHLPFCKDCTEEFVEAFGGSVQRRSAEFGMAVFTLTRRANTKEPRSRAEGRVEWRGRGSKHAVESDLEEDFLIVVLHGSLRVKPPPESHIPPYEVQAPVVLAGFLTPSRRQIQAKTAAQVHRLGDDAALDLATKYPKDFRLLLDRLIQFEALQDARRPTRLWQHVWSFKHLPVFRDMASEVLEALSSVLQPTLILPGEVLFAEGEEIQCTMFLECGSAAEEKHDKNPRDSSTKFRTWTSGTWIGNIVLIARTKHSATIKSTKVGKVQKLTTKDFVAILSRFPQERQRIRELTERAMSTMPETDHLAEFRFFQELPPSIINMLRPRFMLRIYFADEVLVEQGQVVDTLYILGSTARVRVEVNGCKMKDHHGRTCVGVAALLLGRGIKRCSSIVATDVFAVRTIGRDDWLAALGLNPEHRTWIRAFTKSQLENVRERCGKFRKGIAQSHINRRGIHANERHIERASAFAPPAEDYQGSGDLSDEDMLQDLDLSIRRGRRRYRYQLACEADAALVKPPSQRRVIVNELPALLAEKVLSAKKQGLQVCKSFNTSEEYLPSTRVPALGGGDPVVEANDELALEEDFESNGSNGSEDMWPRDLLEELEARERNAALRLRRARKTTLSRFPVRRGTRTMTNISTKSARTDAGRAALERCSRQQ